MSFATSRTVRSVKGKYSLGCRRRWRTRQHYSNIGIDILESNIRSATIWMIDKTELFQ